MTKQKLSYLLLAIFAGFVGGSISNQFFPIEAVFAEKYLTPMDVIVAKEFRVIDNKGKRLATLKTNENGYSGLWLYSQDGAVLAELSTDPKVRMEFKKKYGGRQGKSPSKVVGPGSKVLAGTHLWLSNKDINRLDNFSIQLNTYRGNGGLRIYSPTGFTGLDDSSILGEKISR